MQRSVNKFLALIYCELPIDANVTYLVDAQSLQVALQNFQVY